MTFTFENQGANTNMVYTIQPEDEIDSMSLGMLTNNKINGIAPAIFGQMDTEKYIKYNVTAKVSAAQLLEGTVNRKRLLGVFNGIIDAILSAEDYMLDPNSLLLKLDYIFVDVSTCETTVICLPVMNIQHVNPELGAFFKNIIFSSQFDQTENCDHIAQILNYLNSAPAISLMELKGLLERIENNMTTKSPKTQPVADPVAPLPQRRFVVTPNPALVQQPAVQQPVQQHPKQLPQQPIAAPVQQPVVNPKAATKQPAIPTPPMKPAMPVPPVANGVQTAPTVRPDQKEKGMSWFYLMQHYNKENAAIYKSQKDAKKTQQPAAQPAQPTKAPRNPPKQAANVGFAVPGAPSVPAVGFAASEQSPARSQPAPQMPAPQQPIPTQQMPVPVQQMPVQPQPYTQPANPISFGETVVLNANIGETTVLNGTASSVKVEPHLIRIKNREKIPLNKPVFRIGKERSYVDYFIGDNTAISRSHANIINHNGEFFIVDTNSTNHTYVDGTMINSNEEARLSHGIKFRLANEDFEFRMR